MQQGSEFNSNDESIQAISLPASAGPIVAKIYASSFVETAGGCFLEDAARAISETCAVG